MLTYFITCQNEKKIIFICKRAWGDFKSQFSSEVSNLLFSHHFSGFLSISTGKSTRARPRISSSVWWVEFNVRILFPLWILALFQIRFAEIRVARIEPGTGLVVKRPPPVLFSVEFDGYLSACRCRGTCGSLELSFS